MRSLRTGLFTVLVVAGVGLNIESPALGVRGAAAETKSESVMNRVVRWTRARLQAAKKHWAEHDQWFSECNTELENLKKSSRQMSYRRQAHFLEHCMRRKH